ncbi:MAG: hypothetical protein PUC65_05180 [Clostridiales bacterium]|nr:hypothetical protein [Clostridiales bacterium]
MDTQWINHPSLQKMDPTKKKIILDLVKEIEGKPMDKAAKCAIAAQSKLQAMGLSLTNEESNLLASILMSRMNPQMRSQAEAATNFYNQQRNMQRQQKRSNGKKK